MKMKKIVIISILGILTFTGHSQNSPLYIYGSGLDGSTYQKTAIYSDVHNGLLFEAPLDISGNRLPMTFSWRGAGLFPLYIKSNGFIGINNTNPRSLLDIITAGAPQLYLSTSRGLVSSRNWGICTNWYTEGDFAISQSTT